MKIRFLLINLVICVSLLLNFCSAPKFVLKHTGEMTVVNLKNNSVYSGEFLFIKENHIYLLVEEIQLTNPKEIIQYSVFNIQTNQIESMIIEGYSDRSWGTSLLVFQVLPAIVLAAVGASVDGDNFAPILGAGLIPALLTWLLFEGSTPASPSFENLIKQETLEELKKYSRFPQGLTDGQIEELLKINNQKEIKEIN